MFRKEHIAKIKRKYQTISQYRENLKITMSKKYQEDVGYREYKKNELIENIVWILSIVKREKVS